MEQHQRSARKALQPRPQTGALSAHSPTTTSGAQKAGVLLECQPCFYEEIMSMNEWLRAANDELETSNRGDVFATRLAKCTPRKAAWRPVLGMSAA